MKIYIKIEKAGEPTYWYGAKIGHVYEVYKTPLGYAPKEKGMFSYRISFMDAREISLLEYIYTKLKIKYNMNNLKIWAFLTGLSFLLMFFTGLIFVWFNNELTYRIFVSSVLLFLFSVVMYNCYK